MTEPMFETVKFPAKIISGGQTGADRAGLDFAIEMGLAHGGWCPRGRRSDDGTVPLKYQLVETPKFGYETRTEWNARDSDATVIFNLLPKSSAGTGATIQGCKRHNKPFLLLRSGGDGAGDLLARFIGEHAPAVLNVAGHRSRLCPEIEQVVMAVLGRAWRIIHGLERMGPEVAPQPPEQKSGQMRLL